MNEDILRTYPHIINKNDPAGYRLKVTDLNGDLIAEEIVNTKTYANSRRETLKKAVTIHVEIKSKISPAYINIYDRTGKLFMEFNKMKSLNPGFYSYHLKIEHFGSESDKFEIKIQDSSGKTYFSQWTD